MATVMARQVVVASEILVSVATSRKAGYAVRYGSVAVT